MAHKCQRRPGGRDGAAASQVSRENLKAAIGARPPQAPALSRADYDARNRRAFLNWLDRQQTLHSQRQELAASRPASCQLDLLGAEP